MKLENDSSSRTFNEIREQAEAEVVPSSSLVEVYVEAVVGVEAEVGIEVEVEVGVGFGIGVVRIGLQLVFIM